jgi:hypothetical protein
MRLINSLYIGCCPPVEQITPESGAAAAVLLMGQGPVALFHSELSALEGVFAQFPKGSGIRGKIHSLGFGPSSLCGNAVRLTP